MNCVNSGIPGSHYPVSLINSIVGDRQFDCSGMGSGEIGIQWMCAAGASTNIGESVEEQLGLVVCKVTFNQFQNYLVTHLKKKWERKEILWSS